MQTLKIIAIVLLVVLWAWLMVTAGGLLKYTDGGWYYFAITTFVVGTIATIGIAVTLTYSWKQK